MKKRTWPSLKALRLCADKAGMTLLTLCCNFHGLVLIFALALTDLPGQGTTMQKDDRAPKRLRREGDHFDVFALVKGSVSDAQLVQPPLLVYPEAFKDSTMRFWEQVNRTNATFHHAFDEDRAAEVQTLATALEKDYPHMERVVKYYRSLLVEQPNRKPYTQLAFVAAGPRATENLSAVTLGEAPTPGTAHKLQVVFHQ